MPSWLPHFGNSRFTPTVCIANSSDECIIWSTAMQSHGQRVQRSWPKCSDWILPRKTLSSTKDIFFYFSSLTQNSELSTVWALFCQTAIWEDGVGIRHNNSIASIYTWSRSLKQRFRPVSTPFGLGRPWRNVTHIYHVLKYILCFSLTVCALYVSGIWDIRNHAVQWEHVLMKIQDVTHIYCFCKTYATKVNSWEVHVEKSEQNLGESLVE